MKKYYEANPGNHTQNWHEERQQNMKTILQQLLLFQEKNSSLNTNCPKSDASPCSILNKSLLCQTFPTEFATPWNTTHATRNDAFVYTNAKIYILKSNRLRVKLSPSNYSVIVFYLFLLYVKLNSVYTYYNDCSTNSSRATIVVAAYTVLKVVV